MPQVWLALPRATALSDRQEPPHSPLQFALRLHGVRDQQRKLSFIMKLEFMQYLEGIPLEVFDSRAYDARDAIPANDDHELGNK